MANWKILITDGSKRERAGHFKRGGPGSDRPGISAEELLQVIGEYDALIVRGRTKVTPAVFDAGKKLKVVGRAGVGVDNIDLAAAKAHGVTVVNAPVSTTMAVAELTMALMLALVREVPRADAAMKQGKWLKKELEGVELYRKTLGIIGFGRISARQSPSAPPPLACGSWAMIRCSRQSRSAQRKAEPVELDALLAQSDFITLHVPLTPQTRGMIGEQAIRKNEGRRMYRLRRPRRRHR